MINLYIVLAARYLFWEKNNDSGKVPEDLDDKIEKSALGLGVVLTYGDL